MTRETSVEGLKFHRILHKGLAKMSLKRHCPNVCEWGQYQFCSPEELWSRNNDQHWASHKLLQYGGIWPPKTTRRLAVLREISSATPVINMVKMGNANRKSHLTRKGEQTRRRRNPKEKAKPIVEAECWWRLYFQVRSPRLKTSAPFVSLKVNGVVSKFLVDSGARVNVVSSNAVKVFGV